MSEQTRRASRLVEIERLLRRKPRGMTSGELAKELGYSVRTIQRDIAVLESELGVPLQFEQRRYSILAGSHPLAPVRFTLQEARAILMATRLFLRYSDERDPDGISALEKLAETFPESISRHIYHAATKLKSRPLKRAQAEALRVITEAWAGAQTVHIRYRSQQSQSNRETDLDPYLLEPSAIGYATYVVGYSHQHEMVRVFKIDRIQHAENSGRTFVPKDVDEVVERLADSWGVVLGEDQYDITIEFSPSVAERVAETTWHPSQRLTSLSGGGLRLELRLASLLEFVPWVRSWGHEVVVVGPGELREQVAASLREAAAQYR